MRGHDDYGKRVLQEATGGRVEVYGRRVEVDYGAGHPARIDGAIDDIAIEVESRTSKQIRGAVLDLICHQAPKKLLVLLPVHMSNPETAAAQCRNALRRLCSDKDFRVVVLSGFGGAEDLNNDARRVAEAILALQS